MLEIVQADHQPGWLAGTPLFRVEAAELFIKDRAVNLVGKNKQRMRPVQNQIVPSSKQIGLIQLCIFWLHKIIIF